MEITKNQKDLLDFLGSYYSVKIIDGVECLYRKINDYYDIEISGALRKNSKIDVFVWRLNKGSAIEIVERHFDIKDWTALKHLLNQIVEKYSDSTQLRTE